MFVSDSNSVYIRSTSFFLMRSVFSTAVKSFAIVLTILLLTACQKSETTLSEQDLQKKVGNLPLSFQENKGQVDEVVKYLVKNGSTTIFFTPAEVVYNIVQREVQQSEDPKGKGPAARQATEGETKGVVIRQSFFDGNTSPDVSGEDELQGKVNYMVGNDRSKWLKGLRTFGAVRYKDLYPGVDLVYYGVSSQLGYRYEISPGVDYKTIGVVFSGVDALEVDARGNIALKTSLGTILVPKPSAYQEKGGKRNPVTVKYSVLDPNTYGFEVTGFDPALPLVIETK